MSQQPAALAKAARSANSAADDARHTYALALRAEEHATYLAADARNAAADAGEALHAAANAAIEARRAYRAAVLAADNDGRRA